MIYAGLQKCHWIICFALAAEKVLPRTKKLLTQMANCGIHNVLCKYIRIYIYPIDIYILFSIQFLQMLYTW